MFIQLLLIIKTNYLQIYIFMKSKKQHKHSRCLNMFETKTKHRIAGIWTLPSKTK
jgi:hypothetical protein